MESPGKFLRKERETRNISLGQISNFTKIKEHYLKAIEEDRYELLPPAFYVKGFLTGYARYLALDPRDIVLRYEEYLKSLLPPEPVQLQPEAPPEKKIRPWFRLSLVFAAILSTAFLIFYPARHQPEKKSQATPLSLLSPSMVIQSEAKVLPIYQDQQNQPPLDVPRPKDGDLPSGKPFGHEPLDRTQGLEPAERLRAEWLKAPSVAEGLSRVAQAEGAPAKYQFSEPESAKVDVTKEEMPALKVLEAAIGTGIEKDGVQQFLTGRCSGFKSNNQRGYFFTRIKTSRAGKIAHIWLWEGREYHRIEIDVKPPAWSVYSYFTFRPQHAGNWKAEARDGDHVLTSLNFNVVQAGEDRSL